MEEYLNKREVIEAIKHGAANLFDTSGGGWRAGYTEDRVLEIVRNIPVADVAPIAK